jgi:hypothetical protein
MLGHPLDFSLLSQEFFLLDASGARCEFGEGLVVNQDACPIPI